MDDAFRSGFASALLDVLFTRLADFISKEVTVFKDVDDSVRKLEIGLQEAKAMLNAVDQFDGDDILQRTMNEVASFCYDADDLLDDIYREINRRKLASRSRYPAFDAVKPLKNWLVPRGINKLQRKLVEMTEDLRRNVDSKAPLTSTAASVEFLRSDMQLKLVGRDEDISTIVKELTCPENRSSKGVSIVGIRGVGKTAIAHQILAHKENMGTENGRSPICPLHRDRWLIFIDSLCGVPEMAWRDFHRQYLTSHGRKILITTLSPEVAEATRTTTYHLKPLSDELCQELIVSELTLLQNGCSIPPHATCTWAKMSCGLPLVATFLAWSLGRNNNNDPYPFPEDVWNWPPFRKEILPILRSDFASLEPRLKRCFVYLSLFPNGYLFDAEDLILLWLGEGLTEPHSSRLNSNGKAIFSSLLEQSILQPMTSDNHGLIRYEMHRFTHRIAEAVGSTTYVRLEESESCSDRLTIYTRHLSLSHDIEPHFWDDIKHLRGLRTFLSLYGGNSGRINKLPRSIFKKLFSRLRVLALNKTDLTELPDSIDNLGHLRYLDISNTHIQKLPETIPSLYTLQILKLKNDNGIPQLPKNFSDLTNLVFVGWDKRGIKRSQSKPSNIGNLHALRTLPLFSVGDKKGYRIGELRGMRHLQGSLCISNVEQVENGIEAKEALLCDKPSLQRLELEWSAPENNQSHGDVLIGLQPHPKLKELRIVNYGFHAFPQWLSDPSLLLEKLELKGCQCANLPALGQLPALETLYLEEVAELRCLDQHFCRVSSSNPAACFPSLKSLVLSDLKDLKQWTGLGDSDMPRLYELKITDCPSLESLPSLRNLGCLTDVEIERCGRLCSLPELSDSLQSLTIRGCDLLAARCRDGGEDRSKIDRVSKVVIDGNEVPTSAAARSVAAPAETTQQHGTSLKGFESIAQGVRSMFGRLF